MNLGKTVKYMIWNKEEKCYEGVYCSSSHDEYEFGSIAEARQSNCHGTYLDADKYDIHKVEVSRERIDGEG